MARPKIRNIAPKKFTLSKKHTVRVSGEHLDTVKAVDLKSSKPNGVTWTVHTITPESAAVLVVKATPVQRAGKSGKKSNAKSLESTSMLDTSGDLTITVDSGAGLTDSMTFDVEFAPPPPPAP